MKGTKKQAREKWLHVRFTQDEFKSVGDLVSHSTCRTKSEYARRKILDKPITVTHRNKSLDDFMQEMILLRNELNAIGNNFNQAVHRLHVLKDIQDYRTWVLMNEPVKEKLFLKIDEIKNKVAQISDSWLQ